MSKIFKKTFAIDVISNKEIPDCLQVGQIESLQFQNHTFLRLSSGEQEELIEDQALNMMDEFGIAPEDF